MIQVKLYAYLRDNRGKVVEMPFKEGLTVAMIAEELKIDLDDVSIVICNGKDDVPSKMKDVVVKDETEVHFFPPVAGG